MSKQIHPLISITIIVILSLLVAAVLFGVLSSTGIFKNRYVEFGGAAAGFFATLSLLQRWYSSMEKRYIDTLELVEQKTKLEETLRKMNVPVFEVPTSFVPFIDHEHSMLLCYPSEWRRQPLMLQVQGMFSENPLNLRPSDEFPGQFNVIVSSPGQKTFSLKEVVMMAKRLNLPFERVTKELGVKLSPKTESLQVPLERVLSLMGAKGRSRKDQIYEFNYQVVEALSDKPVLKETEVVNGRESLLIEREVEQEDAEPLVQFLVITYVPETDLIFTFTFTDNVSDRSNIDLVRKQVLNTVKYW
jgi:hypothetical protein